MAGHHDREGIAGERHAYVARRATLVQPRCDFAVRSSAAARYAAGEAIDFAIESRHAVQVERDRREIDRLALQQCDDALERVLHGPRRRRLARVRKAPQDPRPGLAVAPLGQTHGDDAALAPHDGAASDWRGEKRKAVLCHGLIFA